MRKRGSPSTYFSNSSRGRSGPASHLVSIRLPEELLQRLAAIANDEGLAMSDSIRLMIERGLTATQRKRREP